MPLSSSAVHVAPQWAATWRPVIPVGGMQLTSGDMALAAMVAGRWAEYEPCPCADEPTATLDHLKRMRDEGEVDGQAIVSLAVDDITAVIGRRSADAIAGMVHRARLLTNDGEPMYRGVERAGDVIHFHVASGRALVPAHRRLARMMRGRGARGLLCDHSYVSLEPGVMSRFASALSSPVYARVRSWLHAPGDAGLPKSGVDVSEDGSHVRMTVPAGDVMRWLGIWGRNRPSAVDGLVQLVALDLATIHYHVGVTYVATRGNRPDTAHIVLTHIPRHDRDTVVEPDALGIAKPAEPRTGRFRRVPYKEQRATPSTDVSSASPVVTVRTAAQRDRVRMGAAIAPTVDLDADIPPMPEPDFSSFLEKPELEPIDAEPGGFHEAYADIIGDDDADGDEDDDEAAGAPQPHDGWGWQRDATKDDVLWGGSEDLAHLDERGSGYDFAAPGPDERPLALPGDVHAGPPPRDDTRPSWLVRHLPYSVGWLGGWADRGMSAIEGTAMANWKPTAIWMPGMGAQPAHVWSAADLMNVTMRAMDRQRWQNVRSRLGSGENDEGILGLSMGDYAELDARFGGAGMEPWDAHLVRPDLSPRDAYYADLAEQRTRDRVAAARAVREASKASKAAAA